MNTLAGQLFVVAAPSGAGKTTLVKSLVESVPNMTVSISHTTRAKRPNEVDGVNYHFIDETTFSKMIEHHDFLEYATIFTHHYGTSKSWVEQTLASGIDVVLEIDWQGHQQIKKLFPTSTSIFILPPSLAALHDRLTQRNQDNKEVIVQRLADAKETISHIKEFDFIVVNDQFEVALTDLQAIVLATRLKRERQLLLHAGMIQPFLM